MKIELISMLLRRSLRRSRVLASERPAGLRRLATSSVSDPLTSRLKQGTEEGPRSLKAGTYVIVVKDCGDHNSTHHGAWRETHTTTSRIARQEHDDLERVHVQEGPLYKFFRMCRPAQVPRS